MSVYYFVWGKEMFKGNTEFNRVPCQKNTTLMSATCLTMTQEQIQQQMNRILNEN